MLYYSLGLLVLQVLFMSILNLTQIADQIRIECTCLDLVQLLVHSKQPLSCLWTMTNNNVIVDTSTVNK